MPTNVMTMITTTNLILLLGLIFTSFALASATPNAFSEVSDPDAAALDKCLDESGCGKGFSSSVRTCQDKVYGDFGFLDVDNDELVGEFNNCVCETPNLESMLKGCYSCYIKFNQTSLAQGMLDHYNEFDCGINIKNGASDTMRGPGWAGIMMGVLAVLIVGGALI